MTKRAWIAGLVLAFVGMKMLTEHWIHIPVGVSLAIVGGILLGSGIISVWIVKRREARGEVEPVGDPTEPFPPPGTPSAVAPSDPEHPGVDQRAG